MVAGSADDPRGESPEPAFHAHGADATLLHFDTRPTGLAPAEAQRRLAHYGPNRLPADTRRSGIVRFALQFNNLLIYVLVAAALMAAAIGHVTDALVIIAVVVLNAVIGFVQEGRAESAMEAIREMIDPHASVLRDGQRLTIAADRVVPGDIVLLEAGDRVPADLRLFRATGLKADEAVLTGESVPVDKQVDPVAAELPLGDRLSMAFSGSFIAAGQGKGVAVATGIRTQLGRISTMIGSVAPISTPLLRHMNYFARQVTLAVLCVAASVFGYALWSDSYATSEAFMLVVGLAVAAIPEELPAVLTITLAVGVQRMARRRAIIRRLPAVETLGAVAVICTDKTGTLTRNEMTVTQVVTGDGPIEVAGAGYAPTGGFTDIDTSALDPAAEPALEALTLAGLLCNDAALREVDGRWIVDGDPMEGALVSLAVKAGHDAGAARAEFARVAAIPFDARHRYMATLNARTGHPPLLCVKGAPETVIAMCADVAAPGGARPIDSAHWLARVDALAGAGRRVLAIAQRAMPAGSDAIAQGDVHGTLTLLGLVGLIDPPRAEAVAAIAECHSAGIAVKMITGDHAVTARAIAIQIGLGHDPHTLTGGELDRLDDAAFAAAASSALVFARTSPEQKLRLVVALQRDGAVVAMTGDGVNDAPALKRADIGVAMGQKGTEAAKDASDMVLADDNFASIVAAVREGRTVYDNLTKVIAAVLPTNGGEALTIVAAILFGLTLPITPVQILWINMVTTVALGLALAFEPPEPGAMQRPPRKVRQSLLSGRLLWRIVFVSLLIVAGTFGIYTHAIGQGHAIESARTMAVNTMVVMEIFYLFSVRYVRGASLTWQGVLGTPAVLVSVALVIAAQMLFTFAPVMNRLFDSHPVAWGDGMLIVGLGLALLLLVEAEKWIARRIVWGAG